MFRKIYYLIPSSWRHLVRWLIYLPYDLLYRNKSELLPPARLIYTGNKNFKKQGESWVEFFKDHATLKPSDAVLDIGSGIGRIAIALTAYSTGHYQGFDAVKTGVDWCIKNIQSNYSNFKFDYFPLYNDLYNDGGQNAAAFQFPYEISTFDIACAISVFTHMLPAEVENYLYNMQKVLKKGAHVVCTFFIWSPDSWTYMNKSDGSFIFKQVENEEYALMDAKVKSANVAFKEEWLEKIMAQNDFQILEKIPGHWSGRSKETELSFQDIWVLQKV